jgi:hypothetical protein
LSILRKALFGEQNTLYPLLRRLEKQGLLDSSLYLPTGQGGMQGFRLVFLILTLISAIELAVVGVKNLIKKILRQA